MSSADSISLDDWTVDESISFSPSDPESVNAVVDRVIAACPRSLTMLGLGEPTHLVNDYLLLRNRLFQCLVERHGFSAIAIESSFTRGAIADDFVAGRDVSIDDAIERGITHNMGKMPANRELLEWMRQYNSGGSRATKLRFYGFDSPTEMMYADSPRQLLMAAVDYLASLDRARGEAQREQIEPLIGNDADWENTAAMMDPAKSIGRSPAADALRLATEDLIGELATFQPQGLARDASPYRRAMRYAVHARQMLTYHAAVATASPNRLADLLGQRDAMMADNLQHIAEQEKGRGRVMVFAHNSHLKRGQAVWQWGPNRMAWWPAGAHLAATMEERYAVIGVSVGKSVASKLDPAESGTLEARLLATPGPARLIPTHLGKTLKAEDLPIRRANPGFFPFDQQSLTDFDFLAVLDQAE